MAKTYSACQKGCSFCKTLRSLFDVELWLQLITVFQCFINIVARHSPRGAELSCRLSYSTSYGYKPHNSLVWVIVNKNAYLSHLYTKANLLKRNHISLFYSFLANSCYLLQSFCLIICIRFQKLNRSMLVLCVSVMSAGRQKCSTVYCSHSGLRRPTVAILPCHHDNVIVGYLSVLENLDGHQDWYSTCY